MPLRLRTPRRRIPSRTRQRYYDITGFFRRALGSSSQTDNKTFSGGSYCVQDCAHIHSNTDEETDEHNEYCNCGHETSLEELDPQLGVEEDYHHIHEIIREEEEPSEQGEILESDNNFNRVETPELVCKFDRGEQADISIDYPLYLGAESDDRDHENKAYQSSMGIPKVKPELNNDHYPRSHRKKGKNPSRHVAIIDTPAPHRKRHDELMTSQSESAYYHSTRHKHVPLKTGYSYEAYNMNDERRNLATLKQYQDAALSYKHKKKIKRNKSENLYNNIDDEPIRQRKSQKKQNLKIDHDFIADLIRKQYKPTQIFDRRRSDISQFSAPVCRDREISGTEPTRDNQQVNSCYHKSYTPKNNRYYYTNFEDVEVNNLCETSSPYRRSRSRSRRRKHDDIYNDSTMYDLIPVKEKSSPKLHRRHGEYAPHTQSTRYKEVPPSPRTRRPRLNLQSQYEKYYDVLLSSSEHTNLANIPHTFKKTRDVIIPGTETEASSEQYEHNRHRNLGHFTNETRTHPKIYQNELVATSNTLLLDEDITSSLNKTQETSIKADNTDKALREIKDILQNFLQEIKKESPDTSFKTDEASKTIPESTPKTADNHMASTNYHQMHCNPPQCSMPTPFMAPPLGNSCYPVLPVCPMNCVQSGYIVPHPSFTCLTCKKSAQCQKLNTVPAESSTNKTKETDDLVKEIYKFITLNPKTVQKESPRSKEVQLTSRSVGSSHLPRRRDAKVGTPKVKYQSRSCEAIGSGSVFEPYGRHVPHASYSDTVIEKLSVQQVEESEISTNGLIMDPQKPQNKFTKVLKSFGMRRTKSPLKESSEEATLTSDLTESIPVEFRGHRRPSPFRQDVHAYMMHGIDYDSRPPPLYPPPHHQPRYSPHHSPPPASYHHRYHGYGDVNTYNTRKQHSPPISEIYNHHAVHHHPIYEHEASSYRTPYDPHYSMHPPQIPLCLKEVEVKSTSTQSEKKLSFFRKFGRKQDRSVILTARTDASPQRNFATQTAAEKMAAAPKFTWGFKKQGKLGKKFNFMKSVDPFTYGYEAHKKLAEGDINMRDALLNKIFNRRTPFSPKNMLMKSILGKDKSGFGEPGNMFRQRFLF